MDHYFEYVLKDSSYVGIKIFIMQQIQGHKMGKGIAYEVVDAWNKMHTCYCIQVEWGIGGLKQKS